MEGDHQTYRGGPPDVRSAKCTGGRTLLFEYPLDNTWTYEAAIEPLGENHRTYALWPDVRCFSRPINSTLPPSCFSPFSYAPRLPECYQSVSKFCECLVSVCVRRSRDQNVREVELLRFCFKEVMFDPQL
jgi:hypothetical protein